MRGSECAYWLRLGLLLVCRSLRLSWALVCGALLGVCVALLRSLRRMDFRVGVGADWIVGPTLAPSWCGFTAG